MKDFSTRGQLMQTIRGRTYRHIRSRRNYELWEVIAYLEAKQLKPTMLGQHFIITDKPGWHNGQLVTKTTAI